MTAFFIGYVFVEWVTRIGAVVQKNVLAELR